MKDYQQNVKILENGREHRAILTEYKTDVCLTSEVCCIYQIGQQLKLLNFYTQVSRFQTFLRLLMSSVPFWKWVARNQVSRNSIYFTSFFGPNINLY